MISVGICEPKPSWQLPGKRHQEPLDHWREPILCQTTTGMLGGRHKLIRYELSDRCRQNKVCSGSDRGRCRCRTLSNQI